MIAAKGTPQRLRSGWQQVREWIAAELQQLGLVVVRINGKGMVAAKECLQIRCSDEDTLQRDFAGLDHLIFGCRWLAGRTE